MLRAMTRSGTAEVRPISSKLSIINVLLITATVLATVFQIGCSGVTSAAQKDLTTAGQFSANANSVNLGNVALGDSKTVSVTFTNPTNSAVTILNISISGPGFGVSGIANGTILDTGQSATLSVTFTPSSTGTQNGSVTISSNAQNSTVAVALQATGVPAGDHAATLSWNASGSPVLGYNVYRGSSSGGPYVKLNATPNPSLSYTDSSVAAGQSYFYVVTSVNSANVESSYSNEAAATVPTP
jgi:hypothetical protein